MRIKAKIFITILFCTAFLLFFASLLFYLNEKKTLTQQIFNQLESIASLQSARLDSIIEQNQERMQLVSSRTQLRLSLEKYLVDKNQEHQKKMIRILQDAKSSISSFKSISIVSLDGTVVASTADSPSMEKLPSASELFIRSQKEISADTLFIDDKGNLMLLLGGPLHLNGKLLGVIFIESDVNNIIASISNYSGLGESGEVIIAEMNDNGDALFLFPTRFDRMAALKRIMSKEDSDYQLEQLSIKGSNLVTIDRDYRGQKVLTVARYVGMVNWIVLVKLDESEAFADIARSRNIVTFVCVILILIAAFISFALAKSITKPITYLSSMMGKVSGGDLSISIEKTSDDEIGILSESFNEMIQKRKQTEETLRKSEGQLRTLIETLPDLVWLKDPEGVYLACNPKFERFFGAKQSEIIGKTDYDFVNKELADFFREKDKTAMRAGKPSVNEEEITYADDGHTEMLETIKTPMYESDGSLIGVLGIARDITERKEMAARLQQASKMEAIGTMAGGIAHDFNNILAAIIGYAELAEHKIPDFNPTKKYIEQVLKAGNRAKDLISHILSFSRMQGTTQDHVPVDMISLVKEVLKFQRSVIPTTIKLQADIDENCGQIKGDPTAIHQILMNLCTNASHAMEGTGGILEVGLRETEFSVDDLKKDSAQHAGIYIELTVRDTGTGIVQEYLSKIFDPYFTTKEVSKGSGMGLAVVQGIVKNHGGFIQVESEIGKGTTFKVFFPRLEQKSLFTEGTHDTKYLPTGTERILFVDDEEMLVDIGKAMLEQLGYSVTTMTDSVEALEEFRKNPTGFDLVITDQTMPGMPGAELAKSLLQLRPDIPIILCTGYSSIIDDVRARRIGIKEYALKPVEVNVLSMLIRKVLD